MLDSALSGLRGAEATVLEKMLQSPVVTSARDAAITMLGATIVRAGQEAPVQALFHQIVDDQRAMWQRSALLRGLEVALLSAQMPGSPASIQNAGRGAAGRGEIAADPVAGGGGAGGGGARGRGTVAGSAPAFPGTRPRDPNGRPAPAGSLRLRQEPVLVAFAAADRARSDPSGGRARARGIPRKTRNGGGALTAEETRRFEAGRAVYTNVCRACHMPDGRGQTGVAPSLVGSPLALARAGITARILFQGKEGTLGLMPPLGTALTDEKSPRC